MSWNKVASGNMPEYGTMVLLCDDSDGFYCLGRLLKSIGADGETKMRLWEVRGLDGDIQHLHVNTFSHWKMAELMEDVGSEEMREEDWEKKREEERQIRE